MPGSLSAIASRGDDVRLARVYIRRVAVDADPADDLPDEGVVAERDARLVECGDQGV